MNQKKRIKIIEINLIFTFFYIFLKKKEIIFYKKIDL
jgi:hypothetical protein